jgi:hypothetical protein
MATISDVFDQAASRAGTTSLTLVSNQGDAVASYIVGDLRYAPAPSEILPGGSPVFQRNHLESSADATVLFSDRVLTLPGPDPAGFGPQQPFDVEAPNTATLALAPAGSGDSHSSSWDVNLALPAPFNRTFDFTAEVMGSTLVGTTPAIGISENVDQATHVMSLRFIDAPK